MKVSNETKVGILTIFALTVLVLGFNFLKNKDLFKKRKLIYAVFPNLGGLSRSNEVKVNGYLIGTVYKMTKKDMNADQFIVSINLNEEVNIPKDSKAIISSPLVLRGLYAASTYLVFFFAKVKRPIAKNEKTLIF